MTPSKDSEAVSDLETLDTPESTSETVGGSEVVAETVVEPVLGSVRDKESDVVPVGAPILETPESPLAPPRYVPAHAPVTFETPESPAPQPYRPDGTIEPGGLRLQRFVYSLSPRDAS
jgi:hypothetical protein